MRTTEARINQLITRLKVAGRGHASSDGLAGGRSKTPFEEFLLGEYTNIAQAHFNTVDSLSTFFKHYIVLSSVPIAVAFVFVNAKELKSSGILELLHAEPSILATFLWAVAAIGFLVLGYLVNLRCDVLLYARAVNGIRRYFYSTSPFSLEDELRVRILPKTLGFPLYFEPAYFLFVVLTFAVVGTGYFAAGLYFYLTTKQLPIGTLFASLVGACALAHLILYGLITRHRERGYLRGHIIGVDVDGVLNQHRAHFATVLKTQVQKEIDPEAITRIPVHEIPDCGVTEADEHAVFNWPPYWHDMPACDDRVSDILRKIRNLFGYRIWIFTHRGWPQGSSFPAGRESEYWSAWSRLSWWAIPARWRWLRGANAWLGMRGFHAIGQAQLMRKVTKRWLAAMGIKYDKLIIERGNTNTTDPLVMTRNRFVIARHRKMRIFVEDDLLKARKLAEICEVVFLLDHPYNQNEPSSLPSNLVRVKSWAEIYENVRRIF